MFRPSPQQHYQITPVQTFTDIVSINSSSLQESICSNETTVPTICSEDVGDYNDCCSIMSDLSDDTVETVGLGGLESVVDGPVRPSECFPENIFTDTMPSVRAVSVVSPATTPLPSVGDDDDSFFSTSMEDMSMESSSSVSFIESLKQISFTCIPVHLTQPLRPLTSRETLSSLPDELVLTVSSFLDVHSLCTFRQVARRFRDLGSRDEAGWLENCQRLWSQKSFVCAEARSLANAKKSMEAFRFALHDSKHRMEIRSEELCYQPETGKGMVWEFRFKDTAGSDWTSFDPWFSGRKARRMVFLEDGSIKQLVGITGENGELKGSLRAPFFDVANDARAHLILQPNDPAPLSRLEMKWRFVSQPMDLPKRPNGAYIRLTVDGRDVPTYVVHRSTTGDWGFVMESCWGVFSSSPLPRRTVVPSLRRRPRMRLRRTRDGGRWLNVDGIESESEDEGGIFAERLRDQNDDVSFSVSTTRQWREALLYNYGAVSLPEGEDATAEFDRVWNQSVALIRGR